MTTTEGAAARHEAILAALRDVSARWAWQGRAHLITVLYRPPQPAVATSLAGSVGAQTASSLLDTWVDTCRRHPGIVAVYDVNLDGPVPFIVSELVEGTTLEGARCRSERARCRSPGRRCAQRGARDRAGASRPEAVEHQGHARRAREDPGLRRRQDGTHPFRRAIDVQTLSASSPAHRIAGL